MEKLNKLLRYERKDILRAADSTGKESLAKTVQKKSAIASQIPAIQYSRDSNLRFLRRSTVRFDVFFAPAI